MSAPFTLLTWNLFQGLHHTAKAPTWARNERVDEHLAAVDADVLVLPEMWHPRDRDARWAENFAAGHGYELHQWISDRPSRKRERVNWRMVVLTRIPARRLDDVVFSEHHNFSQRAMVRVELVDSGLRIGGTHQLGIHLLGRSPRAWQRERAEYRAAASELDIVAGDMNMWSPIVRRDSINMRSACKGRTFSTRRPHSQIDHVMVNGNVEVLASERLPDLGSDHLGFKVKLARRQPAG